MMGAGGFIRNPGWEILSGDDLMDEDYVNGILIENPFEDEEIDVNSQFVLFVAALDEDRNETDDFDDIDNEEEDDDDDEDYVPDSLDDEDFDDDNAIVMSSDDSAPELSN